MATNSVFPISYRRKARDLTLAELTTADSAIHSDISHAASAIYVTAGPSTGTLDATATADILKNGGGAIGVHAFNRLSATGVRVRSSYFVAQTGSVSSTFSIALRSFGNDAVGKKMAVSIADSAGAILATTVVTLTNALTVYSVTTATTALTEYHAVLSNDPGLGADANARCFVGAQSVVCPGATGIYAPGYKSVLLDDPLWSQNGNDYDWRTGSWWTFASPRGRNVTGLSFLGIVTAAASFVLELSGNRTALGAPGTGVTALINGATIQDYKLTADTVLTHQAIALPGVGGTTCDLYATGQNARAGGFLGTLYRRIIYRAADAFTIARRVSTDGIGVFGDSISDTYEADPPAQYAWNGLALQAATGLTVVNDCTGGTTLSSLGNLIPPGEPYINEEIERLLKMHATTHAVFLAHGSNDFQQETGAGVNNPAFYTHNLVAWANRLYQASPATQCFIYAIWEKTTFEYGANGGGHTLDDYREAAVEADAQLNSDPKIRVVLVRDWLLSTGNPGDDFSAQGIFGAPSNVHPRRSGHQKITTKTVAVLATAKPAFAATGATIGATLSRQFAAAGGSGVGFRYWLHTNASGGTINAKSGLYQAGTTPGVDVIATRDSLGQVCTRSVTVLATPITITGGAARVDAGATLTLVAAGGVGPYVWSIGAAPSGGSVNASTGVYTGGLAPVGWPTDIVIVTDSLGHQAGVNVRVSPAFDATTLVTAAGVLRGWYEGDFGITRASNGKISQQNDRSLSAHHLTSIPAHQPVIDTLTGPNGFPWVRYERGLLSTLSSGGNVSTYVTSTERTICMVASVDAVIGTVGVLQPYQRDSFFGDTSGYLEFGVVNDAGTLKLYSQDFSGASIVCMAPQAITVGAPFMAMSRKSGGFARVKLNQNLETSIACGAMGSTGFQAMVGGGYVQVNPPHGRLAAMLIWDGDIGGAAEAAVESYLLDKYLV